MIQLTNDIKKYYFAFPCNQKAGLWRQKMSFSNLKNYYIFLRTCICSWLLISNESCRTTEKLQKWIHNIAFQNGIKFDTLMGWKNRLDDLFYTIGVSCSISPTFSRVADWSKQIRKKWVRDLAADSYGKACVGICVGNRVFQIGFHDTLCFAYVRNPPNWLSKSVGLNLCKFPF